ncbi:hypothetical protein [Flavobacterium sp. UBA6135]|uniref:hypothetical protein n=1 Tax=Flavobacterium sp. UBA6135 TaxID=1946553 RepID=UPI0025C0C2F1|nr:hypothetical protein [Flavobacterium sp. UBA6135]
MLQHYDSNNYFQNGLTLPFIIGSRTYIETEEKLQTIRQIIEDFKDSNCFINVLKCDTIGTYVFRISEPENVSIYRCIDNFVIIDSSFSNCTNIKEIIIELESLYMNLLISKSFSKIGSEWSGFNLKIDVPRFKEIK